MKRIVWIVLGAFIFSIITLCLPSESHAYDNPPWDQGHQYSRPEPVPPTDEPEPPPDCKECQQGQQVCRAHMSPAGPCFVKAGDYIHTNTDLTLPGLGFDLEFTRTYNSQEWNSGPLGHGWNFTYNIKVIETTDETNYYALIKRTDGKRWKYTRNPDGLTYTPTPGKDDILVKNADGSYILAEKDGTNYKFNTQGDLILQEDKNGNRVSVLYDATGCICEIKDTTGRKLTLTKGANGKISSITDSAGRTVSYGYDATGNLTSFADPMGNSTSYSYDSNHRMVKITDPKGNVVAQATYTADNKVATYTKEGETYTPTYNTGQTIVKDSQGNAWTFNYDDMGYITKKVDPLGNTVSHVFDSGKRLLKSTDANGNTTEYTYDNRGNTTSVKDAMGNITAYTFVAGTDWVATKTNALGRVTKYEYDNKGNKTKEIRDFGGPLENTTTYTYDGKGNITNQTDPIGYTTQYQYDADGYLIKEIDALGNTTTYTYDTSGNKLTEKDALGNTTTYTYDLNNRLTSVTDPLGNKIDYAYDENGHRMSIMDKGGNTTKYEYDLFGRVIKETNPLDSVTQYRYNSAGKLESATDADNNTTTFKYNAAKRLVETADALGNTTLFSYDNNGNLKTVTDAKGNITTYEYDKMNRVIKIINAEGGAISYAYDNAGKVKSVIDANNHATIYDYDSLNRLIKTNYADGTYEAFSYDANSKLKTKVDRKGQVITYDYNQVGRLVKKAYPDSSAVIYSYNYTGNLVDVTDNNGTIHYDYDKLERIAKITHPDGKILSYEYDERGNRSKLIYPDNDLFTYTYNKGNFIDQIKDSGGQVIAKYSYDALGRKKQADYYNGTQTLYIHGVVGRLSSLTNQVTSDLKILSQINYGYDRVGNVSYKQYLHEDSKGEVYTYDQISQLLNVKYKVDDPVSESQITGSSPFTSQTTYNYDSVGNRISTANGSITEYTTNNMNQYTTVGGTTLAYDKNGNLVNDGTNTYDYDYENRLVRVNTPTEIINYHYDYLGRRISKTSSRGTINYLYDGFRLVVEMDSTGSVIRKYIANPDSKVEYVMMKEGRDLYVYENNRGGGAPILMTDKDSRVVWKAEYDVFGHALVDEDPDGDQKLVVNNVRFPGQYYDEETELHYNMMRYYNPKMGRYLRVDPIGFSSGDVNLYTYCLNNPVNMADPYGLAGSTIHGLRKCYPTDDCPILLMKMENIVASLQERVEEMKPYSKTGQPYEKTGDKNGWLGHVQQINQQYTMLLNCQAYYLMHEPPCCDAQPIPDYYPYPLPEWKPEPYEEPSSKSVFDWKYWEELTGLTGTALLLYLLLSEGSRLFPPRNVVPVP